MNFPKGFFICPNGTVVYANGKPFEHEDKLRPAVTCIYLVGNLIRIEAIYNDQLDLPCSSDRAEKFIIEVEEISNKQIRDITEEAEDKISSIKLITNGLRNCFYEFVNNPALKSETK
jgi:hypothetical protein